MFKKWFKPKWMHAQPEMRRMAIASLKLNKPEHREALAHLALTDEDASVRLAAAERIEALTLLLKVYLAGHSAELRISLAGLLIKRILSNGTDWAAQQEVLDQIREPEAFRGFISEEYPEPFVSYCLQRLPEDQAFFAQLAQSFGYRIVRQQAAERLTQQDALKAVLETAKSKDKSVYRIVKQKLDALRQVQREEADQREEVTRILGELKRLTQLDPDPLLPHKVRQLAESWAAIELDLTQWQAEFDSLISALSEKGAAFQADQARQKQIAEDQAAAQDNYEQVCQAMAEALDVISSESAVQSVDLTSLRQVCETQQQQWLMAEKMAQPSAEQRARYQKITQDIEAYVHAIELLKRDNKTITASIESLVDLKPAHRDRIEKIARQFRNLLDKIQWPLGVKRPSLYMHMTAGLKQAEDLLSESKQAITAIERKIGQQMKALKKAIAEGVLKDGQIALREIHALLRDLPIRAADTYQKDLRALMQSLNELRDWQGFATIPKKQALLEKMQALADAEDVLPQDRADRVKQLQQEWRDLGTVQSPEEKALWVEFKAAGEKAFEPCKAYFEDQQNQREQNLANREIILTELETYLVEHDWQNAVWPMVMETLKAARAQWRANTPVDRRHHQRTQRRFDKVVGEIQEKVDAERDLNAKRKTALVERATELLDSDDLDAAIDAMKGLQHEWKQIGIMHKGAEQRLWATFQKTADALFAQRKQRREDQDQQRTENKQRVIAITQSVVALSAQDAHAVLEQQEQVKAWVEEFEQIAPLPKSEAKNLRQSFRAALQQYEQALSRALTAEVALAFESLIQANQYLDKFERALTSGDADAAQLAQLKEAWQQVKQLPTGSDVGINMRFDATVAAFDANGSTGVLSDVELEKTLQSLHETVLQLEILLGVDSPSEDRDLRMSLQVNRLSEKMGGKSDQANSAEDAIQSLVIKWCAISKLGAFPQMDRLDARFQHAVQGWLKRSLNVTQSQVKAQEATIA